MNYPFPPKTFLGIIKKPVENKLDFFMKFLLVLFFINFLIIWEISSVKFMKNILKIFLVFLTFSSTTNSQKVDDRKVLIMWGGWEGHQPELFVEQVVDWLKKEGIEYVISNDLNDLSLIHI